MADEKEVALCDSKHEVQKFRPKENNKMFRKESETFVCALPKGHKGLCCDKSGRVKWRKVKAADVNKQGKPIRAPSDIDTRTQRIL